MEQRELKGGVRVTSMQQGHCSFKMGTTHLVCQDRRWKVAVRLHFQVHDRWTWDLKDGVKIVYNKTILITFPGGGETIRMKDFDPENAKRFVETFNLIRDKKVPVDDKKPWQDVENLPHPGPAKTQHKPTQSAPRVPLSPKQPHTSKPSLNPSNSSARKNIQFLHQGQSKSAEKLSFGSIPSNFYGKSNENQRHYGALGVGSVPRQKRPGLMPDPERYSSAKRARNYDWGKKPTTPTKTELHGFSNLGNTCYMNAILQSLFHLPTFAADLGALFLKVRQNEADYADNALFKALGSLLNAHRNDGSLERKRRCLSGIKNAISASAKRFSGYQQHDAHEFLGQVLDQLKDETIKLNKTKGQGSTDDDVKSDDPTTTPEGHNSSIEETAQGQTYENPTIKNFEFTVMHTIQCQVCEEVVQKEETFHDLSLDIPRKARCMGARTLQHALDQFFEDEKIEYTCEKCGSTDSHVQHKFTRLPRIMIMHLKRYSILQQGLFCGKSGGSTAIPRYITLRGHCTQQTSPPFPPDLNHSFEAGSETKKRSDKLSDILDIGDDTPSRRKLNFHGTFKQVKPHVQVDAAKNLNQDDFSSEAKFSQERSSSRYQSSGEDTDGADRVQTLSEDIEMISDDDFPHIPIRKEYEQRRGLAQVDGTMDPHDSEVSQGSLDEEEVRQLTEEEQVKLALSRSLHQTPTHSCTRHTQNQAHPAEQSPPLIYPTTDDEEETEPATQKGPVDADVGHSKTDTNRHYSTDSGPDVKFKDGNNVDSDDVSDGPPPGETRDSKRMRAGPKPYFPLFTNRLTPAKKKSGHGRVMHSTPNAETEHGTETKSKEERLSPREKVEPINLDDFNDEMTEEVMLDLEKDVFGDSPEPAKTTSDRESKKQKLVILESDDDGLLESPVKAVKGSDKENVSPPRVEADTKEPDWIEKRREDAEKEDREFQEALQMSLREQEATEQREKEELRRATELSLREFNGDVLPVLDSDDEGSDTEGVCLYTPKQLQQLSNNWRSGVLPYSYRLVSVVSHLGSSSNVGHYVCDALDIRKNKWSSYDDSHVSRTDEINVCTSRQQTGYVFFYCAKELTEELEEMYQNGLHGRTT